jgi:hypothetical protein
MPATWTQAWTQDPLGAGERNATDVSRPALANHYKLNKDLTTTYCA